MEKGRRGLRLLLDTHVFLWWVEDHPRLSSRCREAILQQGAETFVSVATVWEVAIKAKLGQLHVPPDLEAFFRQQLALYRFSLLPIALEHAVRVRDLPLHHQDPFDRLLIAQSLVEGLTFVSADRGVTRYGIELLW